MAMSSTPLYQIWLCLLHHSTKYGYVYYTTLSNMAMSSTPLYQIWLCLVHHSTKYGYVYYTTLPNMAMSTTPLYQIWLCLLHHSIKYGYVYYTTLLNMAMSNYLLSHVLLHDLALVRMSSISLCNLGIHAFVLLNYIIPLLNTLAVVFSGG